MTGPQEQPALVMDLWREQSRWSRTADRLKTRVVGARVAALGLVTLAAVAGTAATLPADGSVAARALAGAAALAAALLPFLRPRWSGTVLQDWTGARAVAEALKSEVYLWLARAGDYRGDDAARRLAERTDNIMHGGSTLLRWQHGIEAEDRALPQVRDAATYFAVRVSGQIDGYYRRTAERLRRTLHRFRMVEVVLSLAAAALGVAAGVQGASFAPWIAVCTTVGAAVTTHVAAGRYEYRLVAYLAVADELKRLSRRAAGNASAEQLSLLVVAAEQAISSENQAWLAKLAEDAPDHVIPPTG